MIEKIVKSNGCKITQIKLLRYLWVMNADTCPGCGGYVVDCPSYDISGSIKPKPQLGLEFEIIVPGGVFYYIRNNPHDLAEGLAEASLTKLEPVTAIKLNWEDFLK